MGVLLAVMHSPDYKASFQPRVGEMKKEASCNGHALEKSLSSLERGTEGVVLG